MDPKSGPGRTWAPCTSGAVVNHFQTKFIKQIQPPRLRLDLNLGVRGAKSWVWWLYSLNRVNWQKNYKTNVKEHFHFIGADHIFGPIIQIYKDVGNTYFWSSGQSVSLILNCFKILIRAMPGTPASTIYKRQIRIPIFSCR